MLDAAAGAEPDAEWAPHRQAQMRMEYYLSIGRPERFHAIAKDYGPNRLLPALNTAQDSARQQQLAKVLENIAWQYAEFVKKKKHLAEALDWLNRCPENILSADGQRYLQDMARKTE